MKAASPLSSLGSVIASLATFLSPCLLPGCGEPNDGTTGDLPARAVSELHDEGFGVAGFPLRARVVARGIPGAGAITQVGTFRAGGPFHDNPVLAAFTAPGRVLDPKRLLVAGTSNYGAPLARPTDAPGTVLSIDVSRGEVAVPADFAAAGGQAATPDGRVIVYSAQNAAFLNSVNNPAAVTAALPAVSLPLGISLNRGGGRPWIANAPTGVHGEGTITVDDPSGAPLAGAPDPVSGGVFAGNETNRDAMSTKGLDAGAVATAFITRSPDGSGRAVFLAAEADGSIVQVHVQKGVDGLAPAGTFSALPELSVAAANSADPRRVTRVGMVFNWVPARNVFVSDPLANRIVVLDLDSDAVKFSSRPPREIRSRFFDRPVDLAPATTEVANGNFASNTTLGGGGDIYVLNRGDNTIVRMTQDGRVTAIRRVDANLRGMTVSGIATSEDSQTLWVTAVTPAGDGVVLQLPAFGQGSGTDSMVDHAAAAGAVGFSATGADMFVTDLSPRQGLGPLFNARSCSGCHAVPAPGGMGAADGTFATRVGRIEQGLFDDLEGRGGPVARAHSIAELGFPCNLPAGPTPLANVTSRRSAMSLRGNALMDMIAERDIVANQAVQPAAVRGKLNRLADGRLGRFGWKGQVATLVEFMGAAFRDEMGVTNPLVPHDEQRGCPPFGALFGPDIDAVPLQDVTAFMSTLDPPVPAATCLASAGATLFASAGCADCHKPSFAGPGRTVNLYSDMLLHDMGPAFDDRFIAGAALGSEWRTMPLWRVSERVHFLHDGRAPTIRDAIAAHAGQAAASAAAFGALDAASQQALLDFLGCI
ncbi:MAG TPA: di-heme oxidoredictase family protein [Polyangia bacterium]|nr:di-heme oxidoredictase family protein [Polyangia bacterium]